MSDKAHIERITKMLFEDEPGLLACDADAVARASASCAEAMGNVIAVVLAKKGEATYREVLKSLFMKTDAAARRVVDEANRMSENAAVVRSH